jgi:hypothetical protein
MLRTPPIKGHSSGSARKWRFLKDRYNNRQPAEKFQKLSIVQTTCSQAGEARAEILFAERAIIPFRTECVIENSE